MWALHNNPHPGNYRAFANVGFIYSKERPRRPLHGTALKEGTMSSPPESDRHPLEPHPVIPTQRARQGATGHNVRYVLGFGLAAVVILFVILYLVYFG